MRITRLRIENFRSIKALDLELGNTTVFIGPNDAGKTAILDAIRMALTRRWGQRGTGFTEYDIHLATEIDDPKASSGVVIEIRTEEEHPDDWPDDLKQDLEKIIAIDPNTGRDSITLRATCAWNVAEKCFQPSWTFLNAVREPLAGASARRINLDNFWSYLPVFYLGALRNVEDEFSTRSQFWGRLLKAMQIPSELEGHVQAVLDDLNQKLLAADPRLGQIAQTLSGATRVAAHDRAGSVDLRLVPLKSWDLLSKAEIILRDEPEWPWLPLQRHGQGLQSLSVIFLFQAFIEQMRAELYNNWSTPVLALEEPETHLHPQAIRTLWTHINQLPGQKIVTTHSPYFVQHVPIRDVRLVRLTDKGTEVSWIPPSYSAKGIPDVPRLQTMVGSSGGLLTYEQTTQTLTVHGKLVEVTLRKLQKCYGAHTDQAAISLALRDLHDRSLLYITDEELRALETFAMRIRGEIFFARRWMIVEGQSEYLIVHALARQLGYDLDEHGVSVIDAQNNGSPAIFAVLARAIGMPWLAVFDGDEAGRGYVQSIIGRDFPEVYANHRCWVLPAGNLEEQLLASGLEAELRAIYERVMGLIDTAVDRPTLLGWLQEHKTTYAAELATDIAKKTELAQLMPLPILSAISALKRVRS